VYRFLLRPTWLLSHLAVLALVVVMFNLGLWQLNRLDEKQGINSAVEARSEDPVAAVGDLVDPGTPFAAADGVEYRTVEATGVYQSEDEVLVHNRSLDGSPGRWVLTPLLLENGAAVIVNRGWIPLAMAPGEPRPEADPPTGEVMVSGLARTTQTRSGLQAGDPSVGVLDALARPDLERYGQQLDYDILPVFIQLETQDPVQEGSLPVPLDPPELSEGPHLGYAVQWFIFTLIALIGYPLVLRRVARSRATAKPAGDSGSAATVPS
jgi:surfeit locus 1 family protein